ncbi:MAG: hypothetical protein Tsb0016_11050 [Sphingomonadales bacterium]
MAKSEHLLFIGLALICLAVSIGGVHLASVNGAPSSGGRGGAVAVALAFGALFLTRSYGHRLQRLLTETLPDLKAIAAEVMPSETLSRPEIQNAEIRELTERVSLLENKVKTLESFDAAFRQRLNADADGQKMQNLYLAFSSIVGTIFWGFGDIFAGWLV